MLSQNRKSCQSLIFLSSHRQSLGEKTRKASPQDLVLRQSQVIGNEPKPDRKRSAIVNERNRLPAASCEAARRNPH